MITCGKNPTKLNPEMFQKENQYVFFVLSISNNVWVKKTETIHSIVISHSSKSIWVIKLSFCQNNSPMGGSFWQKDSLITHILFELWLIMIFSSVANFAQQSLLKHVWCCIGTYETVFSQNNTTRPNIVACLRSEEGKDYGRMMSSTEQ